MPQATSKSKDSKDFRYYQIPLSDKFVSTVISTLEPPRCSQCQGIFSHSSLDVRTHVCQTCSEDNDFMSNYTDDMEYEAQELKEEIEGLKEKSEDFDELTVQHKRLIKTFVHLKEQFDCYQYYKDKYVPKAETARLMQYKLDSILSTIEKFKA